jgi:hypothetical protein
VHLSRGQEDGSQRVQNQDCREDEGEQSTQLLQLPPLCTDWCGVWHCHVGGGLDSSSCLAILFKFIVLTSLMSAHIALHWLWHLSPRIPLTRLLHCSRHDTVAGWPLWSLSPSFSLLLKQQTHHSLPTTHIHNIHHLALKWWSTYVTEWSTNKPGAAGQCRYLEVKARNSNWHHIKKKKALLSYQPSYVTLLAYGICGVLSNLWGSGQEHFWKTITDLGRPGTQSWFIVVVPQ